MRKVVYVKPLTDYRVQIRFEDGKEGIVSLADLVGKGVFKKWQDPQEFSKVEVDPKTHAPTWPGGIDLCPDSLYDDVSQLPQKEKLA